MAEPPSVDGHEIADRGYVNQHAMMDRRVGAGRQLFSSTPEPEVIEIP